jgi:hypothetical protein
MYLLPMYLFFHYNYHPSIFQEINIKVSHIVYYEIILDNGLAIQNHISLVFPIEYNNIYMNNYNILWFNIPMYDMMLMHIMYP